MEGDALVEVTNYNKPFDWLNNDAWSWIADMSNWDEYRMMDDIFAFLKEERSEEEFVSSYPELGTDKKKLKEFYESRWQGMMASVLENLADSLRKGEIVLKIDWEDEEEVGMKIGDVLKGLTDGFTWTPEEMAFIEKRLVEIMNEDGITIEELDTMCWEDSASMFDRIFRQKQVE